MTSKMDEEIYLSQEPFLGKTSPSHDKSKEDFYSTRGPQRLSKLYLSSSLALNIILSLTTATLLYMLNGNREARTNPPQLLPCKCTYISRSTKR